MDLTVSAPGFEGETHVTVTLSRRNLLSLLAKLEGHPPGSACTIERRVGGMTLTVRARRNDDHYADRTPGPMHPDTEAALPCSGS